MQLWSRFAVAAFLLTVAVQGQSGVSDFIVEMKNGEDVSALATEGATRLRSVPHSSVYLVRVNSADPERVLNKIRGHSAVAAAETNVAVTMTTPPPTGNFEGDVNHAMADLLEGDGSVNFFGSNVLKLYAKQPALEITKASQVWNISTGLGTRIAYIDTGVDPDHEALKPWLDPGFDLIQNRTSAEIDGLDHAMADLLEKRFCFLLDRNVDLLLNQQPQTASAFGHGTMVAGLLHAIAPQATLIPIKAFTPDGNTTMFAIVDGIYRVVEAGADVLNMSFSTGTDSQALHKAINTAHSTGMTLVASVGNESTNVTARYPAAYQGVYGIAATDLNDKLAFFSNYGKEVSLAAPGSPVVSTAPGNRYALAWGTSFSSPIVAGAFALVSSMRGHGQADANALLNSADSIDDNNPDFRKMLGNGRINLARAFAKNR